MKRLEKWIWLDRQTYPDAQTTILHPDACSRSEAEQKGHYTVAEFAKTYHFTKRVKRADLRFGGDTTYDVWLNGALLATGPADVGGDFLFNDVSRDPFYATELTVSPESDILMFYARVKMQPVRINEYSKGRGGFMLTAHLTLEDDTVAVITTDRTWSARRNGQYTAPYRFDGTVQPDEYGCAEEIPNVWHTETAPIPARTEELLYPDGGVITVPPHSGKTVRLEYDRVYGGFLTVSVKTAGLLTVEVVCFELEEPTGREKLTFSADTQYRGLQLHSVGGFSVTAENDSDQEAVVTVGCIATCYPAPECSTVTTGDAGLNLVLRQCVHALKYCRQTMHLDSPRHCEPLACTGDYYIESLMTAFSFGDMRLAAFDVRRTAESLRHHDGRMFHTAYSLIWVLMLYDVYRFTGDRTLLEDCADGLWFLLHRFESYIGDTGLIEHPPDYMFIDWLEVDGYSLHHPPKNLGQSCLNMFYYGALATAAQVYAILGMEAMAAQCRQKAAELKATINRLLYHEKMGLYFEGLSTPTPEEELYTYLPQGNGKIYYRKHANILAAYFGICDPAQARTLLRRVITDGSLGECQPYFMHFLLEAVYRNGLRELYTVPLLEQWKQAAAECPKGLQEGFIRPGSYPFDLSHAWGGTPLYALPKALLGFEMLEPGFQKIQLKPTLLGLSSATVEMLTPFGRIVCRQEAGRPPVVDVPKEIAIAE